MSEADEFHLPLKLITSRYAALLALQQGAQYFDIFLLIDFIEHALLNVAANALCPKCLLNFATPPLIILYFVVDESTCISLIIDKFLFGESFHDACLSLIAQSP